MPVVHRAVRYRLHPGSGRKAVLLWGVAGACRFVWNHFVAKLRDDYAFYGECNPRYFTIGRQFTNLRHQLPWLRDYSCAVVRASLKPIQTAYEQFYKGAGGLPRFKARHRADACFPLTAGAFRMDGDWLHIQKIGQVKLSGNNPYAGGRAVSGTVRNECGKWYAYIVHEVELPAAAPRAVREVGLDRNAGQVTLSDGARYETPDIARLEARKRRYQRMMARRRCGSRRHGTEPSKRYLKARLLARKTHQKIVHKRTNWCHQVSKEIAAKYAVVYLENLNTAGMTASAKGDAARPGRGVRRKAGLNRTLLASGWGKLEQCLGYKAQVVKVPAAYTSQRCRRCGHTAEQNRKTQAAFHCVECGHRDNADINAALNILASGTGAAGRGGGGVARPGKRQMDGGWPCQLSI